MGRLRDGRRRIGALLALAGAFALPACGGDDSGEAGEGPAQVAPAETLIYLEAAVQPEGDDAEAIEAIAARFPGGENLGDTIVTALDESFAEENQGELTFEEDVEPWLGERGAVVLADASDLEGEANPSVIVEVTDEDAAQQFIDDGFATDDDPEQEAEYEGVSYTVGSDDGEAIGVVEGFLVAAGDEERMQSLIDVATGAADSLADSDDFSYSAGDLDGEEAPGFARLDPAGLVEAAVASDPAPEVTTEQVTEIAEEMGFDLDRQASLALATDPDAVRLDASSPIDEDTYPDAESTELLGSLPSDALLAGACAPCLDSVAEGFELGFAQAAAEDGVSEEEALEMLEDRTGLDLEALRDALGGVAYFARGSTLIDLEGAVAIEVLDEAAVSDALEGLTTLLQGATIQQRATAASTIQQGFGLEPLPPLPEDPTGFTVRTPQLPVPIHVALTSDRLVVALGDGAAEDAIDAQETLASSGALESAESTLGGELDPTMLVDLNATFDLIGLLAGTDPGFLEAQPYLEPFDRLIAGTRLDGDVLVNSTVVSFD
jgi:Protein of unknown function (DUF3352)